MADKKSKFGLGLLIGALGGGLAALLYAPKKGEDTRKQVNKKLDEFKKMFSDKEIEKRAKEIFGEVSKQTKDWYLTTTKDLLEKVTAVRSKVDKLDKRKYQKLVDNVVSDWQETSKESQNVAKRLKDYLVSDWKYFIKGSVTKPSRRSPKRRKKPSKKS